MRVYIGIRIVLGTGLQAVCIILWQKVYILSMICYLYRFYIKVIEWPKLYKKTQAIPAFRL